jgi:hypothetical protein
MDGWMDGWMDQYAYNLFKGLLDGLIGAKTAKWTVVHIQIKNDEIKIVYVGGFQNQ